VKEWSSSSPDETWNIAAEVVQMLGPNAVLALHGELGAGKTCFTQGVARALKINDPIISPTYTLISEYHGTRSLFHIDLYRLSGPAEAFDLGLDEYFDRSGLTVIEWAERAAELLPERTQHIEIHPAGETARRITLKETR